MIYPPTVATFYTVQKVSDGLGGYNQTDVSHGTLRGYLDMLTGDDEQSMQMAHIETSTHVLVVKQSDNRGNTFVPSKGDKMDFKGKRFVVTYVDDPVGIGHHLEIFLDNLVSGVS